MGKTKKRQHARLLEEDQPDSDILARIDHIERHRDEDGNLDLCGYEIETYVEMLLNWLPDKRHGYFHSLRPQEHCTCPPGSEDHLKVLRQRVKAGMALRHPCDAKPDAMALLEAERRCAIERGESVVDNRAANLAAAEKLICMEEDAPQRRKGRRRAAR